MININFPADAATVRTVGCGAGKGRVKKWRGMFHRHLQKRMGLVESKGIFAISVHILPKCDGIVNSLT